MRVSARLGIGFSIVLFIAVIVGALSINGMRALQRTGVEMYESRIRSLSFLYDAMAEFNYMTVDNSRVLASSFHDDKRSAEDSSRDFLKRADNFEACMNNIRRIAETNAEIDGMDEMLVFHGLILDLFTDEYLPKTQTLHTMSISDIPNHHNRLYLNVQIADIYAVSDQIERLLTGMVDLNTALANQANIDNAWLSQRNISAQLLLLAAATAISILTSFLVTRSIAVPINESEAVLKKIAQGDFEARITGNYKGSFETIKNSINNTAVQLSSYLDEKLSAERAAHEADIEKARIEAATQALMSGIKYAGSIQRNLLPAESAMTATFTDYSVIWKPRDVVGGDIYWMKRFQKGAVLCVADCTGHGTPGALLTMLVVSALETAVKDHNCHDTAEIIWRLEQRLTDIFGVKTEEKNSGIKDGCDLAALFISNDGIIRASAGNTNIYVCGGKESVRFKGQKLYVGEGRIENKEQIKTAELPAGPGYKYYIASDGLYDQYNNITDEPFGYERFANIILANHDKPLADITAAVWAAFEEYRGDVPQIDDFELIAFQL